MNARERLLFVSPRFLFPADSGGRIRTTEVLRNLKGGRFEVTLACPRTIDAATRCAAEVEAVCDRVSYWEGSAPGPWHGVTRMRHLLAGLPVPVATDRSPAGKRLVAAELAREPDLVVFDFPHAAVLAPDRLNTASVLFTHNVEAEIFARHIEVAANPFARWVWRDQHRKMQAFERAALARFDRVVAVSERDCARLEKDYGADHVAVIPTGVNLGYFDYADPQANRRIVFTGSMDWLANIDGISFFMDDVWPAIVAAVPDAQMIVVGRAPPAELVDRARSRGLRWTFTGRVDDIRPHVRGAAAYAIPLRVGGGTRIKAFEAMAMGVPVVSTAIGIEGLEVEPGRHFQLADTAQAMARELVRLITEPALGRSLARTARAHVESKFSNATVARVFEQICGDALAAHRRRRPIGSVNPIGVI